MVSRHSVLLARTHAGDPFLCTFRQQERCGGSEETGQLVVCDQSPRQGGWQQPLAGGSPGTPKQRELFICRSAEGAEASWDVQKPRFLSSGSLKIPEEFFESD